MKSSSFLKLIEFNQTLFVKEIINSNVLPENWWSNYIFIAVIQAIAKSWK